MAKNTVTAVGDMMVAKSQQVSPSTKTAKPQTGQIFSKGSQFSGVLNGVPGDPRK